jgi:hypothetical protein
MKLCCSSKSRISMINTVEMEYERGITDSSMVGARLDQGWIRTVCVSRAFGCDMASLLEELKLDTLMVCFWDTNIAIALLTPELVVTIHGVK